MAPQGYGRVCMESSARNGASRLTTKLSDRRHECHDFNQDADRRFAEARGWDSRQRNPNDMKVKVPSKTVICCDVCRRESVLLETCLICGKEYCFLCESYLPGCMIRPDVCKKCDDREDVIKVVARYSKDFVRIDKARAMALKRLRKKPVSPN